MVASMIKTMKCEIRACFDEAKGNTQATQILNNFEAKFSSGGEFASLTVVKTAIDCLKDDSKPLDSCATDPSLPMVFMSNQALQTQMMGFKDSMSAIGASFKEAVENKAHTLCTA